MIGKTDEYNRMYQVEMEHWWYKHLHHLVLKEIQTHFTGKEINILDAGCGTGGFLSYLQQNGYTSLHGFDGSPDAIEFAKQRTGMDIRHGLVQQSATLFAQEKFDVICCLDVMIYLKNDDIENVLAQFRELLQEGGIIIANNASKGFKGTHDFDVGILKRFSKTDIHKNAAQAGLKLISNFYWNFLLSPPVWLVRKWKLFLHNTGMVNKESIGSDLTMPSPALNQSINRVLHFESRFLNYTPWGTSLFSVFCK